MHKILENKMFIYFSYLKVRQRVKINAEYIRGIRSLMEFKVLYWAHYFSISYLLFISLFAENSEAC